FQNAFNADLNFLYFDLIYGTIMYFLFYKNDKQTLYVLFLAAMAGDFFGNAAEFISRFGIEEYFSNSVMATLLAVAVIRGTVAVFLISALNYYNSFLRKEEHDERYRMQMDLISELRGEIYFLKNNMDHVEQVMDESFSLYREYDVLEPNEKRNKALSIAKNVHEIKKNYFRAVEGIDDIINKENPFDQVSLSDISKMIYLSTQRNLVKNQMPIELHFEVEDASMVHEHSMLMSVLRNLIVNAIESIEYDGQIHFKHQLDHEHHIFQVKDTGGGISEEKLEYIFNPGYSTKYDEITGNSNRGIGLTLVKDIVENYFGGSIEVKSEAGTGTEFIVMIPKISL
ncbi:MAG: sensor histidine kinase, partial [Bacillota bacterium]|nr:sensor histidine kinase [Bacillota bacterium]